MKTKTSALMQPPHSRRGEPTWEVAQFYPPQGDWTEADYLSLQTNHLVELSDGVLEILPMPTHTHQMIVANLYGLLKAFVDTNAPGTVLFAPLRMRLWEGKFREPDLLYMRRENQQRISEYWDGADLVMEVVSPARPDLDRATKRADYAQAGIPEYWIVDVLAKEVVVLVLAKKKYPGYAGGIPAPTRVHGKRGRGSGDLRAGLGANQSARIPSRPGLGESPVVGASSYRSAQRGYDLGTGFPTPPKGIYPRKFGGVLGVLDTSIGLIVTYGRIRLRQTPGALGGAQCD